MKHWLNKWFKIPEKIRFLIVGGWNTVFSLLVFVVILKLIGNYKLTLLVSHVIGVFNSFITFKFLVFRTRGNFLKEYIKVNIVYVIYFILNFIMLTFAVEVLKLGEITSQVGICIILTVFSYMMNKYFTFNNGDRK
jgi:putative flippase GtrA